MRANRAQRRNQNFGVREGAEGGVCEERRRAIGAAEEHL